eukprot:Awhi_evm1s11343
MFSSLFYQCFRDLCDHVKCCRAIDYDTHEMQDKPSLDDGRKNLEQGLFKIAHINDTDVESLPEDNGLYMSSVTFDETNFDFDENMCNNTDDRIKFVVNGILDINNGDIDNDDNNNNNNNN